MIYVTLVKSILGIVRAAPRDVLPRSVIILCRKSSLIDDPRSLAKLADDRVWIENLHETIYSPFSIAHPFCYPPLFLCLCYPVQYQVVETSPVFLCSST